MPHIVTTNAANVSVPYQPSFISGLNSRTIVASGTVVTLNDFEFAALSSTAFTSGNLLDGGNVNGDGSVLVSRATAVLPQTATGNIFAVTGRVGIKSLFGEITTAMTATATTLKVGFDPTGADPNFDLSTTGTVTSLTVGTLLSITGTSATALQISTAASHISAPLSNVIAEGLVLTGGGNITLTTSASNATGSVKWDILYVALSAGATITAV
jgi:hypothetical protein